MYKSLVAALCAALLAPGMTAAVDAGKFVEGEFSKRWSVDGFQVPAEADKSGYVDLLEFVDGKPSSDKHLTCRSTFTAPRDGLMLLGAGADWWFDISINGAPAFSIMDVGNADFPISINNQVAAVPVKAGINEISVTVRSGSNGCSMAVGALPFTLENYAKIDRRQRISQLFPPSTVVLRKPLAIRPETTGCALTFGTDGPVPSGVAWRKKDGGQWNTAWELLHGQVAANRTDHLIEVEGLAPDTEYELRVTMVDQDSWTEVADAETFTVKTLPAAGNDLRFFATGDTQFNSRELQPMLGGFVKNCNISSCDFIIHLGDLDNRFSYQELSDALDPLSRFNSRLIPVVQARGNHEYRGIERSDFAKFFVPDNRLTYYAFSAGDAFIIVLDSGEDSGREAGNSYAFNFPEQMLADEKAWLAGVIESQEFKNAKFRIVLSHGAPEDGGNWLMADTMREMTDGFFTGKTPKARIHLWLSGHIHRYLRTIPGAAAFLSPDDTGASQLSPVDRPYTIASVSGPGRAIALSGFNVTVSGDKLKVEAVTPDGELLDAFTVHPDGSVDSRPGPRLRLFGPGAAEK
ncbi:MAG: metallophosphoesterase [Victivallaceae bacterium]|nr:metallophosphoesterase [Victivallaceae bacterium]